MEIRLILVLIIGIGFSPLGMTQVAPDPMSLKWKQINTELAKVVYPTGKKKQAERLMNILLAMDENNSGSVGVKSRKIIITLHDQTIVPNGSVSTFPYQSNFFMTPPQSPLLLGTGDWMDLLTIHEYRHVQQAANLNVGLTKALTFLLGDAGLSTTSSLVVPNWYSEGDAVVMETALSPAGRGRMPNFNLEQRAALMNDKSYAYMKVRNGSLKDWLPDHYPLGYTMCAYAREEFGNDVWAKVLRRAAGWQGLIYPFSHALKKETGLNTTQLYEQAYEAAKKEWTTTAAKTTFTAHQPILAKQKERVRFYHYPLDVGENKYLSLYSSYQDAPGLYLINNGKPEKLIDKGISIEPYLAANKQYAIWTEVYTDPRYEYRNYSDIIVYDYLKKTRNRLTRKAKYFTPDISNDGVQIIATAVDNNQRFSIHIINRSDAQQIYQYDNLDELVISYPKFTEQENEIVFLARKNNTTAILLLNTLTNQYEEIVPWSSSVLSDLYIANNQVYFSASFSGIDNIYSAAIAPKAQVDQLTSVKLGAYNPSVSADGQRLIYSNAEANGIYLASMDLAEAKVNSDVSFTPQLSLSFAKKYLSSEKPLREIDFTKKSFEEQSFSGLFKGFKVYAWYPEPNISDPQINIEAVNNLRSLGLDVGIGYDLNEKEVFSSISVQRSRGPIVSRLSFENRRRNVIRPNRAQDRVIVEAFKQNTTSARFSLPLTYNNGAFTQNLNFLAGIDNRWISDRVAAEEILSDYQVVAGTFRLQASNVKRRARQNVFTRFGQSLFVQWQNVLNNSDPLRSSARQEHWQWGGTFFVPGIHKNHSIRLDYGHRREDFLASYQFNSGFVYPRGYDAMPSDAFNRYSVEYRLPLWYPDWGFAGLTYFRRLRANVFYDHGSFQILDNQKWTINSAGAEILFDNSILNVGEISVGVRYAYQFNINVPDFVQRASTPHQFEFILTSPFE